MAGTPTTSVRYATTRDGLRIAYAALGDGPPLVFVRALNSHVVESRSSVRVRRYFEALENVFCVTRIDARGNGLSDATREIDLDRLVEDVRAVVDDAGLERFTLFGQGFGSPVSMAFAAQQPDRVERLVLYCAHARGLPIPDVFLETMRTMPRQAFTIMAHDTYPDESIGTDYVERGLNAPPATAVAYFEFVRTVDVRALLPGVRAPTLVLQPERSPVVNRRFGREVADGIAGAQYVEIAGGGYNPWAEHAFEETLLRIGEFCGVTIPLMPHSTKLALLLTDIVGSTEMTHRLGEERARTVFHTHDAIVKDAVDAHHGAEVKHTGDGTLATFADVGSAVRCASAIVRRVERERPAGGDLMVRMGIAFGDVVEERGDLFGTTVMQVVRITNRARGAQILVSEQVFDAVQDEGFAFGAARLLALKGFPARARLRELLWAS